VKVTSEARTDTSRNRLLSRPWPILSRPFIPTGYDLIVC